MGSHTFCSVLVHVDKYETHGCVGTKRRRRLHGICSGSSRVISEGEGEEDAIKNIREVIELYLKPVVDDLTLSPEAEQIELAI